MRKFGNDKIPAEKFSFGRQVKGILFAGLLIFLLLFLFSCTSPQPAAEHSLLNTQHLQHLIEDIEIDGREMSIVHIYAEAPEYSWVEAPGEGIACVDDVARAAVFYLRDYRYSNRQISLQKARKLLNFVLYMQAPNGLFYNFLTADHQINKTRDNSIPRASWWSWRAIWALAEAQEVFRHQSPDFARKIAESIRQTFPAIDSLLGTYPQTQQENGFSLPTWLPYGTAADQAAVLIMALLPYHRNNRDSLTEDFLFKLGEGIGRMQSGDSLTFPYGCFFSWQNIWHAYGNSQSTALLLAGNELRQPLWRKRALQEVRFFYPYLERGNYLSSFRVVAQDGQLQPANRRQFPQIAYDIRPMVWASLKGYQITGSAALRRQAVDIGCWLLGKNITGKPLYHPGTGRCFDGITGSNKINMNSGAESTIEALLTILEIEKYPVAKKLFYHYYQRNLLK